MATLLQAISALILGFIVREAPNVREGTAVYGDFKDDIATMVQVHSEVTSGALVDEQYDILLLSAVNYRESRMRLPAPEGDCRMGHRLDGKPSGDWPEGYRPKISRICNAVGPMQLNRGAAYQSQLWPEASSSGSSESFTSDPSVNVRLAYVVLQHWKNTCLEKDGATAPMGVWLTAYRRGSCPRVGKSKKYYVDSEAKIRCKMANDMALALSKDDSVAYTGLSNYPCTVADRDKVELATGGHDG